MWGCSRCLEGLVVGFDLVVDWGRGAYLVL